MEISRDRVDELADKKFAVLAGKELVISPALERSRHELWEDWDTLEPDSYLKKGASFRLRRFGLFSYLPWQDTLTMQPPKPYFQSAQVNAYAGDIQRQFAPLSSASAENPFLQALIRFNFSQFPTDQNQRQQTWTIDVHQFRIIGRPGEVGEPTPEGPHRDGDDFNAIHLVKRENVSGGLNSVYSPDGDLLSSCTLELPMDTVYVWDPYVLHGVSAIKPIDSKRPALRDVLVIGYNCQKK
jgi:hypothetical protein